MCHNDLHIVIDCAPVSGDAPDVCDMVTAFIDQLAASVHTQLSVQLTQVEDPVT